MNTLSKIDTSENNLRSRGNVLDILLLDRTRTTPARPFNIIWATDSYAKQGNNYAPTKQVIREQITGVNGKLIQPRAAKSKDEQKSRTKDKAEVFTPLKIVKEMNIAIDWSSSNWPVTQETWKDYVAETRLEITCGEAPFIAGRYNPTANTGLIIKPQNRAGFLDRKLQVVGEYTTTKAEWLQHTEVALKASYGYEWQGDNLLIARENILQTLDDFYKHKFGQKSYLTTKRLEYFAEIISWNIWQMDGIKCVIPLTCKNSQIVKPGLPLLNEKDIITKTECPGCKANQVTLHNGRYSKIMDWSTGKTIRYADLLGGK